MGFVFSIASQKGGVGKTTTALNLGFAYSLRNKKVLLIDADPQGGAILRLSYQNNLNLHSDVEPIKGLFQIFEGEAEIYEVARPTELDHLWVVDCGIVPTADNIQAFQAATRAGGLFRETVQDASDYFDVILIDCPPGVGSISTATFVASDFVIIALQCEPLSLRTMPQLLRQLIEIKRDRNRRIEIAGILLTMFDEHSEISQFIAQQVLTYFEDELVFDTVIPRDDQINRLFFSDEPLVRVLGELADTSIGVKQYARLADEIEQKYLQSEFRDVEHLATPSASSILSD